MSLLQIRVLGDPILRAGTSAVAEVTDDIRALVDEMFETMYAARGIGLAAPQVGRTERLAVVDVDDEPFALVNPEILVAEGSERGEESCLSIPDVYGWVMRAGRVRVRALDREGLPFERDATGLLARCLQHEIDHLHGKLFIDYLSYLKRRAALAEWEERKGEFPGNLRILRPLAERTGDSARGAADM